MNSITPLKRNWRLSTESVILHSVQKKEISRPTLMMMTKTCMNHCIFLKMEKRLQLACQQHLITAERNLLHFSTTTKSLQIPNSSSSKTLLRCNYLEIKSFKISYFLLFYINKTYISENGNGIPMIHSFFHKYKNRPLVFVFNSSLSSAVNCSHFSILLCFYCYFVFIYY